MSTALRELVMSGVYQARPIQMARPSLRWSGAAIVGGKISIVTVSKDPDGDWSLDRSRSREFKLPRRCQAEAKMLHANLANFLRRSFITTIFLRAGSSRGPHPAKAESHICEGLLYAIGGVQVHHLSAFSIAPWMRERGYDLERQGLDRGWHLAAATAIYAAEHQQNIADRVRTRAARP